MASSPTDSQSIAELQKMAELQERAAEVRKRAKAYNEAPLKPWQQKAKTQSQLSEEAHARAQILEENRDSDIAWLGRALSCFFQDDKCDGPTEQYQPALGQFLGAVENQDVSPLAAFKNIVSTTALAQQMDTFYAFQGGIDYYILRHLYWNDHYSTPLSAQAKEAVRRRKVLEIKSLMAKDKMEETSGAPATKASQAADGVRQVHEGEVEQAETHEQMEKDLKIKDGA